MFPLTDPILVFTILVLAMLVGPLLAERLRVPDLVLLLIAGAALGPNGFGVLGRDAAVTLFGSVGLIYIMFLAGLEIDLHRFKRTRRRSIVFGLLTFALPQGVGALVGRYVLGFEWPTAILLASMFASHTLLAYPIASRLGIARNEPVAVTVGATIITDTLALMVLAVIADSAKGAELGVAFWAGIGGGIIALTILTLKGIPPLTRWFFRNVTENGGAQFLFVLVAVCACAYLSHFAKLEPIIGAFLAGAAFNRMIPEHSPLMNRVAFAGNTLFIPFFLISVGMLIDPGALIDNPRSWLVAGTMIVLVIATKYLAAWLARKFFDYGVEAGRVMFGLSVVQAAATLAAVLVGYDLNIFDETILNGTIAMIMVTCPLGAWCVEHYGRRLAAQEKRQPAPPRTEQRLLVMVSNPDTARKLLDIAFLLRDPAVPGGIYPVTIVRGDDDADAEVARGEEILADSLTHAAAADIAVNPGVRIDMNPSDGIVRAVRELRSSMVLIGWGDDPSGGFWLFRKVRDNLLDACPARLLFCRLLKPLNTNSRLLLVFPPKAEQRSDFASVLHETKFLSRQMGVDMHVYFTGEIAKDVLTQVEKVPPSRPLTTIISATWKETCGGLFEKIGGDDILIFCGERRSEPFWSPAAEQFPKLAVTRFPKTNFVVLYPALSSGDSCPLPDPDAAPAEAITFIPFDPAAGASLDDALQSMFGNAFPGASAPADEALPLIQRSARAYPIELTGDVVLLHAHCAGIERCTVLVGRSADGWEFPNLAGARHVVLALLSPASRTPDAHLKTLAALARKCHAPEISRQITGAANAGEICRIMDRAARHTEQP